MKIKEIFRNLDRYKVLIRNYQDNINYYYDCLQDDEKLIDMLKTTEENLGIQKTRNLTAPQENEFLIKEISRKRAKEEIERYRIRRNELFNRLFILEKSMEYIQNLYKGKELVYIVECKYMEHMNWNEVEINYNNKFKDPEKPITKNTISNMCSKAMNLMDEFAESYPKYKIDYSEKLNKLNFKI